MRRAGASSPPRAGSRTPGKSWTSSSARASRCSSPSEETERCGAHWTIQREIKKRGLAISVIGIPKTVDNDIAFVERTFGLETAFSVAAESIRSAHTEAIGAPNGIGIVKVMGRMSGYIAANAALALAEVNFCLIPEVPFGLDGQLRAALPCIEQRLRQRDHAVIIVAEGAGQEYVKDTTGKKDESGNPALGDIGVFLKDSIKKYFKEHTDLYVNIKYIDPSYMVRSVRGQRPRLHLLHPACAERGARGHGGKDGDHHRPVERPVHARSHRPCHLAAQGAFPRGPAVAFRPGGHGAARSGT